MRIFYSYKRTLVVAAIAFISVFTTSYAVDRARMSGTPDFSEAILINGVIGGRPAIEQAQAIINMAATGEVRIIINSPGGDIFTGTAIISAIEIAKQRGAKVTCIVPFLAASMAMHTFAHCDNRFILNNSFLLFHQGYAANIPKATEEDAEAIRQSIKILTQKLDAYLLAELHCSKDVYAYHNRFETMWTDEAFAEAFPEFKMIIVKDVILPANITPFTI